MKDECKMSKTLKELTDDLKEYIINQQSDAHNKASLKKERYNNLKLSMDIAKNPSPHVIVSIGMSEAEFDIRTGNKNSGGLGPDERYVLRWFGRLNVMPYLNECWKYIARQRGRA